MTAINNLYDKIYNEVSKSYEIKHENLLKEENELKEKLQNEVTKIKEGLENYYTKSDEIIRNNDKIKKGLKRFEKEEKKSMMKVLSYVSKINKNIKETKILFQDLIKSL